MLEKILKLILSLALMFVVVGCTKEEKETTNEKEETKEEIKEEVKEPEKVELTLSFIGDLTLGNYAGQGYSGSFDQEYVNQGKDTGYFLKNVKSILEKDDLTIGNLEGPLTNEESHAQKKFAFKGKKEYAKILTDGSVEIVTLANNHSQDRFEKGFNDTKQTLDNNNIKYFGYENSYIAEVKGIKIGFIGLSFPQEYGSMTKKLMSELKDQTDLIILYVHWGIERDPAPMASQRKLAQTWIDNGVDLVIGSHPHVLQGIETYKGKKIVYSLGNFCFGGNKNPADKDTMIYQHTFQFEDKKVVKESNKIIPCMITSHKSRNNYQPTVVEGNDAKRVLKKVNDIK